MEHQHDRPTPDPKKNNTLEAAHTYIQHNLPIFPLYGKTPAIPNPHAANTEERHNCKGECGKLGHGLNDATLNPNQINDWFTNQYTNIGIAIPQGIVALDIDVQHNGDQTFHNWCEQHGADWMDGVPRQRTGNGGLHLLFAHPDPQTLAYITPNAPGCEMRRHGHYIVASPSIHPTTKNVYRWEIPPPPPDDPYPPLPNWLQKIFAPTTTNPETKATITYIAGDDPIDNAARKHTTWSRLLTEHGWTLITGDGDHDGSQWKHPTATARTSASIKHGCLFVYSPTPGLPTSAAGNPNGLTMFNGIRYLTCGGDAKKTIQLLRDNGQLPTERTIIILNDNNETTTPSTWLPIDLTKILDGTAPDTQPKLLTRDDQQPLIYPAKNHTIAGESESGKSWFALLACKQLMLTDQHIWYLDFEDNEHGFIDRLRAIVVPDNTIEKYFHYIRPDTPLTTEDVDAIHNEFFATPPILCIIDGVTEAMVLNGYELKDNTDIAKWLALLPKRLTGWGAAVLSIDHVVKDREGNRRFAIGGQHKLAGIDGAAYAIEAIRPIGRGLQGFARITVTKDRPGWIRQHALNGKTVGLLHIDSEPDGSVGLNITAPEEHTSMFRPTYIMEKISQVLAELPGASMRAIRSGAKVDNTIIPLAIEILLNEGYIRTEKDGQTHHHYNVRPYRADQDSGPETDPDEDEIF